MKNKLSGLSRRAVLQGGMALGGVAGGALMASPTLAQSEGKKRIVVGTHGGDYARLLAKNVDAPFLIPKGWTVVQDQAGDPQRRTKMLADKRLARGPVDLHALSAVNMYQLHEAEVTAEIDYGKLKNARYLLEALKYPYGVAHLYSGIVGVYNPALIAPVPTSYKDIFDPKWGDKLALIDKQYQYTLVAAALAAGSSANDLEAGQQLLLECKKAGMRLYPNPEDFAQAMKAGTVGIGVAMKARIVQWQNAGLPIAAVTPGEGALAFVSGFVMPRNAPNKAGAYAYLDAILEKAAQEAFAVDFGYNPTVTNAVVPPELNARIGFTPQEIAKLVDLDYPFMDENDASLRDWWEGELKAK